MCLSLLCILLCACYYTHDNDDGDDGDVVVSAIYGDLVGVVVVKMKFLIASCVFGLLLFCCFVVGAVGLLVGFLAWLAWICIFGFLAEPSLYNVVVVIVQALVVAVLGVVVAPLPG